MSYYNYEFNLNTIRIGNIKFYILCLFDQYIS